MIIVCTWEVCYSLNFLFFFFYFLFFIFYFLFFIFYFLFFIFYFLFFIFYFLFFIFYFLFFIFYFLFFIFYFLFFIFYFLFFIFYFLFFIFYFLFFIFYCLFFYFFIFFWHKNLFNSFLILFFFSGIAVYMTGGQNIFHLASYSSNVEFFEIFEDNFQKLKKSLSDLSSSPSLLQEKIENFEKCVNILKKKKDFDENSPSQLAILGHCRSVFGFFDEKVDNLGNDEVSFYLFF